MSWYKRYPAWLHAEWQELHSNGNYRPAFTLFEDTFLSCGQIVVRSKKTEFHPVLFVYPQSTPYQPPTVYLLGELPPKDVLHRLAKLPPEKIEREIQPFIQFLYRRHQGASGSLCFIETEDLHAERADFYSIRQIIKRVRDWLAGLQTGRLPTDSPEVELFSHFPHQHPQLTFLIPDGFFEAGVEKGRCYFSQVTPPAFDEVKKVYLGVALEGATESSIVLPLEKADDGYQFYGHHIPRQEDILLRRPVFIKSLEEGTFLEGFWWTTERELEPFETVGELASYWGEGREEWKAHLDGELATKIRRDEDLYIGIRFPSRSPQDRPWEWQFFLVTPTGQRSALLNPTATELIDRLMKRRVQAIHGEYVDEQSYFKRNKGIFAREKLKESGVSLFGVGALGSELADCLAKAGVGQISLLDMDILKAQNTVRHLCGSQTLYWPKPHAVAFKIGQHAHHFVGVSTSLANVFQKTPGDLFAPDTSLGVSTIANDNTEGYLNEVAVRAKRTVFYARALRGGKAARIFRVIPGKDACKTCLSLYQRDEQSAFVKIAEDPTLPIISTECNNPIRPASAADLKLIASLTAKLVLEFLEKGDTPYNHWIWSTENLPGLATTLEMPYVLKRQFLAPHPDCPVCVQKVPVPILLSAEARTTILEEVKKVQGIETGGILIGFESPQREIVVLQATEPGPKAIMTAGRFERDIEYCQKELDQAGAKYGTQGLYVGEWHFHPTGRNVPSPLDISSLHAIAQEKNYATDHPVMIIVSSTFELAGTVHPANSAFLPTELTVIAHQSALGKPPFLRPEG